MILPPSLNNHLRKITGMDIHTAERVTGGSINDAVRLNTSGGTLFLKWNRNSPPGMFSAEARGLEILRKAADAIRIPRVIRYSDPKGGSHGSAESSQGSEHRYKKAEEGRHDPDQSSQNHGSDTYGPYETLHDVPFLLMEFIEPGHGSDTSSLQFGQQLATLHQTSAECFGLDHDNYIGRLPQSNRHHSDWIEFFITERIDPQLKQAIDSRAVGSGVADRWKRVARQLPDLIPVARPALLHGDLWGGNYMFDGSGRAVLFDPAVYYGHHEMELAFTKLFGGFSEPFYEGYEEVAPLEPGFQDRIPIYNLYPLLVHVNLFGGHYIRQAEQILRNF